MSRIDTWTEILGDRIYHLCQQNGTNECDYESDVRLWLQDVDKCHRPTVEAVIMNGKRKVWSLTPI